MRGSNVAFSTTTTGEFSRILLPGVHLNSHSQQQMYLKARTVLLIIDLRKVTAFWYYFVFCINVEIDVKGIYTLEIFADGYRTLEHTFAVDGKSPTTILHLTLTPITDFPTTYTSKDGLMSKNDVAEDRTPIYVPKIPKNVWESFLNSLNLLNILTLFPKFFRN